MRNVDGSISTWDNAHPGEIAESTKAQYRHRVALLRRRFAKELGYPPNNEEFVLRLIAMKKELAMRSWRLYKAATMFVLKENAGLNYEAIELLSNESSKGMETESKKGSSKKLKRIPIDVANKLVFAIKEVDSIAGRKRKYSDDACNFLLAAIETGLRPSEWVGAEIKKDDLGRLLLTVKNGKFNKIRANGAYRELFIDDLPQEKLDVIQNTIEAVRLNKDRLPIYFNEINREIKRGMHDLINNGHIHQRYRNVSLYSARHQFAADAKSANLPYKEVAALLGHKSQKTASWHYARKTVGKGSVSIKASQESIARVNPTPPTLPYPQNTKN